MLEYYNDILCVSARELVADGFMTKANYEKKLQRNQIDVVRRGGGVGMYALVAVDSLPSKVKQAVKEAHPEGAIQMLKHWVMQNYEFDQDASGYFMDWAAQEQSDKATLKLAKLYAINASVLNCCLKLYDHGSLTNKMMGKTYSWEKMAQAIAILRKELGHDLPASPFRFRKRANEYKRKGYECLISKKFNNQNSRLVTARIEQLVVSIACQKNRPFNKNVWEMYNMFVTAELDVYDPETGELYNPDEFTDKTGEPIQLSESTINNILNKASNKVKIEFYLNSYSTFMHESMPHMHRHGGEFSLSQITMDDVDLSRQLQDTKARVHAYYAYDVVSQCVIGASYARKKNQQLVVDCFRDMFRLIYNNGWGMPKGIEVENHLMSEYKEGFLKAGNAFEFVHFCAPLNSQEKYAENMNGAKKRSIIHKNHAYIGRWYAKSRAYRVEYKKVSDENNDTYEAERYFSFEQLVAEDRKDSEEWNNTLHPNQKKYPGMTRWDVLVHNINPTLKPYSKVAMSKYVGVRVNTSIRRNSTVRVAHEEWWLSSPEVLEKLAPNSKKVQAYYLPEEDGSAKDVYIYQGERFIDKVEKVETYNRVYAEQTDEDKARFQHQQKKVGEFLGYVKRNTPATVGIQFNQQAVEVPEEEEDLMVEASPIDSEDEDSMFNLPNPNIDIKKVAITNM